MPVGAVMWLRHDGEPSGSPIKHKGSLIWPIGHVYGDRENTVSVCRGVSMEVVSESGHTFSETNVLDALTVALRRLFGDSGSEGLARVFGIQQRSVSKWYRDVTLPPPNILQWVGYAVTQPRGFGQMCIAASELPATVDVREPAAVEQMYIAQRAVILARR